MSRIGVVRNPRSRRNRRSVANTPDGVRVEEPDTPEALRAVLTAYRDGGVRIVAVDGGDGTVREVLTALGEVWRDQPPQVAVVASGMTNVIAADVGVAGPRRTALQRLAAAAAADRLRVQSRSPLEISWPDGGRPAVRGLVFGAAAYARATALAQNAVFRRGASGGAAIAMAFVAAAGQVLVGPERAAWRAGEAMSVGVDGAASEGARFLVMATTLERLTFGLWPFWDHADAALKLLDVRAPPRRLLAALPAVLRGRPRPWMKAAGWCSGGATVVDLALSGPFVVDGETFGAGPGGRIRLRAAALVEFVAP